MKKIIFIVLIFSSSLFAASSQDERENKTLELTVQPGFDYRKFTGQVAAMYFLNANNLLGLKAGATKGSGEAQTNISVQYQSYLGNSFYIAPEIFYLNTNEEVNTFAALLGLKDQAEYQSLGAGIRIGNQWTWKLVTLGCDWIGIGRRVVTFEKETDNLDDTTLTLLNFKFGLSF